MSRPAQAVVLSAREGGAVLEPKDPEVVIAPLRSTVPVPSGPSMYAPWDPWCEQRIGYGAPAEASLLFPAQCHMRRLAAYLREQVRY